MSGRWRRAGWVALASGGAAMGLAGVALASGQPWVFPSLGPTAFLAFASPRSPANHPRRAIVGHALGLGAGALALGVCGLLDAPSAIAAGVDGPRVLAVGVALALTGGGMVAADAEHPPAGATTLIVALGLLRAPAELAVAMLAIVLLVVLCGALRWIGARVGGCG